MWPFLHAPTAARLANTGKSKAATACTGARAPVELPLALVGSGAAQVSLICPQVAWLVLGLQATSARFLRDSHPDYDGTRGGGAE